MTSDERELKALVEEAVKAATGGRATEVSAPLELNVTTRGTGEEASARGGAEAALGLGGSLVGGSGAEGLVTSLAGASSDGGALSKVLSYLNPLAGLARLIGGGGDDTQVASLAKAVLPVGIDYEAGFSGAESGLVEIDRDEAGTVRRQPQASPSIVVQVDAIDSRSFLDRTPEIAEAVKRALLESESLGRVLGEM